MNKIKNKIFILLLILIVAIFSVQLVSAADTGALGIFKTLGTFLFKDLPALGEYGFKFLLWIALFALMNFGLKKAFDNKTAGIVSFVLSLISVLLIPGRIIEGLFRQYAFILVFAFGVFLPLLLIWIIHKAIPDDTTMGRVLRGVTYLIIAYALFIFTNYVRLTTIGVLR